MEDDARYFARRAAEERIAAERAEGPAREAHLDLAHRYDDLHHAIAAQANTDTSPRTSASVVSIR